MSKKSFHAAQLIAEASQKEFSQELDKLTYLDKSTKLVISEMHKTKVLQGFNPLFQMLEANGISICLKEMTKDELKNLLETEDFNEITNPDNTINLN